MPYAKQPYRRKSTWTKSKSTKLRPLRKRRTKVGTANSRTLSSTVQRGYLPFGQSYSVHLPYVHGPQRIGAVSATTNAVAYNFRLNSLFDPDETGTGHQPYQYDQIAPLYARYIVYSCSYVVTFFDPSADGIYVGVKARRTADTPADASGKTLSFLKETKLVSAYPLNNTGSQKKVIKGTINLAKLFGITSAQYSAAAVQDDYGALTSANPYFGAQLQVFLIDSNGNDQTVAFDIKLTYHGRFLKYHTPAQS